MHGKNSKNNNKLLSSKKTAIYFFRFARELPEGSGEEVDLGSSPTEDAETTSSTPSAGKWPLFYLSDFFVLKRLIGAVIRVVSSI